MAILAAIPVVNCKSIEQTLEFYLQLFHFVVIQKRELNNCLQWVLLKHGDTTLMLKSVESLSAREDNRNSGVTLYLYVSDIKEIHHFIKAKNVDVSEVVLMDYQMYEFRISDPEGNIITVGQSVKPSADD